MIGISRRPIAALRVIPPAIVVDMAQDYGRPVKPCLRRSMTQRNRGDIEQQQPQAQPYYQDLPRFPHGRLPTTEEVRGKWRRENTATRGRAFLYQVAVIETDHRPSRAGRDASASVARFARPSARLRRRLPFGRHGYARTPRALCARFNKFRRSRRRGSQCPRPSFDELVSSKLGITPSCRGHRAEKYRVRRDNASSIASSFLAKQNRA